MNTIEANNEAFRKRLRKYHRSEEARALMRQLLEIRKELYSAYKQIALEHWRANGNNASTGWGCVPEEEYSTQKRKPSDCAHELANKLTNYLVEDPSYALGAK